MVLSEGSYMLNWVDKHAVLSSDLFLIHFNLTIILKNTRVQLCSLIVSKTGPKLGTSHFLHLRCFVENLVQIFGGKCCLYHICCFLQLCNSAVWLWAKLGRNWALYDAAASCKTFGCTCLCLKTAIHHITRCISVCFYVWNAIWPNSVWTCSTRGFPYTINVQCNECNALTITYRREES